MSTFQKQSGRKKEVTIKFNNLNSYIVTQGIVMQAVCAMALTY